MITFAGTCILKRPIFKVNSFVLFSKKTSLPKFEYSEHCQFIIALPFSDTPIVSDSRYRFLPILSHLQHILQTKLSKNRIISLVKSIKQLGVNVGEITYRFVCRYKWIINKLYHTQSYLLVIISYREFTCETSIFLIIVPERLLVVMIA